MSQLEFEVDFKPLNEEKAFRFWSGRTVTFEELIDGKIAYKPLDEIVFADDDDRRVGAARNGPSGHGGMVDTQDLKS